ncbi:MAG TPA: dihydroorotase [Rhodocyclaceae bacterium]|nr:dihydroorotase [Rhodocyclaceae bacterium]
MKLQIKNGRLIDPANNVDRVTNLFIDDGRVVAVGEAPAGFDDNRTVGTIDASGCVVCPGLVDLSARLREPGYEYRATLESEMAAAAAGGVTSLACPPDTDPPLDEPGLVEMLKHRARLPEFAKVYPVGALTVKLEGKHITEMAELAEAGCVAFSQATVPVLDTQVLMRALQYASTFGYSVWLSAQDPYLARNGVAHDGEVAARLGLVGIPVIAETIALSTILQAAEVTNARVHITRISSAAGLDMIRLAKARGLAVSCDVATTHLHLSDRDIGFFNPHLRLAPPVRDLRDKEALRQGLSDGTIDALCSDHTPVDDDGKQVPFDEAEAGATGLELLLPLTLKWGKELGLSMSATLAPITSAPAKLLGIDSGHLGVGAPADVCVFDPEAEFRVSREALKSQGKNTPFLGQMMSGRVRYTLIDGVLAYDGSWN